jgi:hypothetical protein
VLISAGRNDLKGLFFMDENKDGKSLAAAPDKPYGSGSAAERS